MTKRTSIRTQILIFTLFGDYFVPLGLTAWTQGLLALLKDLEVSERAGRSSLSRMSKKGWLIATRNGRYSTYSLTARGKRVVTEGRERIFEPRRTDWDGRWHMVVYSIPEGKRNVRSSLRQRLGWMGFGRLAPGAWISPNNPQAVMKEMLDDIGARDYAISFSKMQLEFSSNDDIVRRSWNLDGLNEEYARFLARYEPSFQSVKKAFKKGNPISLAECFRLRFWLTLEYAQFPRRDPNLPPMLLKSDWLGTRATDMFLEFHNLLQAFSETYVVERLMKPSALLASEAMKKRKST